MEALQDNVILAVRFPHRLQLKAGGPGNETSSDQIIFGNIFTFSRFHDTGTCIREPVRILQYVSST